MDRLRKCRSPPRRIELDSDLDRRSVLELTNGTPLGVITVNVDSSEVYEAETWQRNGRDNGGVFLRAWNLIDRNLQAVALRFGAMGNSSDRASEFGSLSRTLWEGVEHCLREGRGSSAAE